MNKFILVLSLISLTSFVYAEDPAKIDPNSWQKDFGLSLGAGVIIPEQKNISDAIVSNGIVRVTDEQRAIPSLWLTTHWTYRPTRFTGYGPFIGLGMNTDQGLFSGMALGGMVSLTHKAWEPRGTKQSSLNIGVGYGIQKIKVLGNGITEDALLPENEESIRFKNKYSHGPVILFSFTVF